MPEALQKQTPNGQENRRSLGPEIEEVNDSDSLTWDSSHAVGGRGGVRSRGWEEQAGGGGEGKRGPFRKQETHCNG